MAMPGALSGALRLKRTLQRERLSEGDQATTQRLFDDLQTAMNTKP